MSSFTQSSAGVNIRELDLTGFAPNVGASGGAFVGEFMWGPVGQYVQISGRAELQDQFGKPTDVNYADWFSASNFLDYTGDLTLIRVVDVDAMNASDAGTGLLIKNAAHFEVVKSATTGVKFVSKYPGALGNSVSVSIADKATYTAWAYKNEFDLAPNTTSAATAVGASGDELHAVVIDKNGLFTGVVGAVLERYAFVSKAKDAKDENSAPNYYVNVINRTSKYVWALEAVDGSSLAASLITGGGVTGVTVGAPGTSYTSATVAFAGGGGSGAAGTVTVSAGGVTGVTITAPGSGYTTAPTVTFSGPGTGATGTSAVSAAVTSNTASWNSALVVAGTPSSFRVLSGQYTKPLGGGVDSTLVGSAELIAGWDFFESAEQVDVSLLFTGAAGGSTAQTIVNQHVIDNIATVRKDCMVFISPKLSDVINKTQSDATTAITATRNTLARSTSFAEMDSGWKMQYDVYNDKYRWVPLNADIAGLCAQVDNTNDPWWSPGGYTRGNVKNVVSLAFNPSKTSRDALYKIGVNPVVTFNTDGTVLYGDKTLQGKNSSFSYIGTRRLFILLQKSIAKSAKYSLFEFNDAYTQAAFRNLVEPFMREIKGRRGMDDYKVICDSTNNTAEVIQRGEFIGTIMVKPQYSIQWVTLNFVAVRRDVAFSEVVGSI